MWVRFPHLALVFITLYIVQKKGQNMNKKMFKKSEEELQDYLGFKKRGHSRKLVKGKGSYQRKPKYRDEPAYWNFQ